MKAVGDRHRWEVEGAMGGCSSCQEVLQVEVQVEWREVGETGNAVVVVVMVVVEEKTEATLKLAGRTRDLNEWWDGEIYFVFGYPAIEKEGQTNGR